MLVFKILAFIFLYLCKELTNGKTISVVALDDESSSNKYFSIVAKINEVAKQQNLDIKLDLTYYQNDSIDYSSLESMVSSVSRKFDLILYNYKYSSIYDNSLVDMSTYLPMEIVSKFSSDFINNSCSYNGHLIGLPVLLDYDVFYANKKYLQKYAKSAPKTWDELLETVMYILSSEQHSGNSNLIGYNGLFSSIYKHILI